MGLVRRETADRNPAPRVRRAGRHGRGGDYDGVLFPWEESFFHRCGERVREAGGASARRRQPKGAVAPLDANSRRSEAPARRPAGSGVARPEEDPVRLRSTFVEGKWLDWMDTEMKPQDAEGKLPTSMLFGPEVTRAKFFQMCSPEDLTLGRSLMRVSSMFVEDLLVQQPFSKGRYGSVRKVYVVCKQDYAIVEEFQRWMIENYPVEEVREIDDADHMAMLSSPNELVQCLVEIAENYA